MKGTSTTLNLDDLRAAAKQLHPDKFIARAKSLNGFDVCKVTPPPYVRTDEEFLAFIERTAS